MVDDEIRPTERDLVACPSGWVSQHASTSALRGTVVDEDPSRDEAGAAAAGGWKGNGWFRREGWCGNMGMPNEGWWAALGGMARTGD